MANDILTLEDVKLLVDTFYGKAKQDELLSPIFNEVIKDNWEPHLDKMYRFWETILLENHTYFGSPFPPHAKLDVDKTHFKRWVQLFYGTIDELFVGLKAEEAKWRAMRMAEVFQFKIEHIRNSGMTPVV